MSKPTRKIEVPGEEPAHEAEAPAPAAHSAPAAPDPSEDQQRTEAVKAQVEATKGLVGSDKALDWGHLTTPNVILDKINHNPDADLPDVNSIDWDKQPRGTTRVLTKQGWLLKNG